MALISKSLCWLIILNLLKLSLSTWPESSESSIGYPQICNICDCVEPNVDCFDKDITKHYRELDEKLMSLMYQYDRYKNQFEKPVEFPANLKGL